MLLYLITKNHSFSDGNKRIAASCFLYFLEKNNILYNGNFPIIDNGTLFALTVLIAESNPKEMEEEQKYAKSFLLDIESGTVELVEGKSFRDYVNEYISNAKNDRIHKISTAFGLDENKLRGMMDAGLNASNINSYGKFKDLKQTINIDKAKNLTYITINGNYIFKYKKLAKILQMEFSYNFL